MGQDSKLFEVEVESSLAIVTASPLPAAKVGEACQTWIEKTGGVDPVTFEVVGDLPDGLVLEPTGNLHGTPTTEGPYGFDVQVVDAAG